MADVRALLSGSGLKVVVVKRDTDNVGMRVFFSSNPALDIATILETYAGRWGIEVFFRDAKQLLGFADSQSRKEAAILRSDRSSGSWPMAFASGKSG